MIEVVAETASTNADLLERLRGGESVAEGHWLRTLRQTAGKGRRGREWIAPESNLACSTVVSLRAGDPPAHSLAFVAALAVYDVVAVEIGCGDPQDEDGAHSVTRQGRCLLKWPNDVLVDGGKVSGVLLERVGDHVVVGIGINVAEAPVVPGRATASLLAAGAKTDAASVLQHLASGFAARLGQWRGEGAGAVLADWQRRATPIGTALAVTLDGEGTLTGSFAGLDGEGALRLRLPDGTLRVVHAGDVSLL